MAEKRELTVAVDADLAAAAEEYARSRRISLSALIERSLRQITAPNAQSFATRWRGRFNPAERDGARYAALSQKYLV